MRVNPVTYNPIFKQRYAPMSEHKRASPPFNAPLALDFSKDLVHFNSSTKKPLIQAAKKGKEFAVVSFLGLKNPMDPVKSAKPAIQMRVTGVTNNQTNPFDKKNDNRKKEKPGCINEIAESKWMDGEDLIYEVGKNGRTKETQYTLIHPKFGEIGRVPDEVAKKLKEVMKKDPNNFRFELSNVVAGTTKGAATIGLRVNLFYDGKRHKGEVQKTFNDILGAQECKDKVLTYQAPTKPFDVLETILKYDEAAHGKEGADKTLDIIDNIVSELEDPENKSILLLGHSKPDGDTLGCVLGMRNALALSAPDKTVVCAVDDKIPGMFRHKVPGITDVVKEGVDPNSKFDLVVMFDVPTPKRFTNAFKNQIEGAKKVIYIDHHPFRLDEWKAAQNDNGVDMEKIHNNKLAWVSDLVPAATQQVAILGSLMLPKLGEKDAYKTDEEKENVNAYVAALVTGMTTDTGAFSRTANMLPEHMLLPVEERPNFMPEGMAKHLLSLTRGSIDKKWLRDEITFDISDRKMKNLDISARETMINYAIGGRHLNKNMGLGILNVSYDQLQDVFKKAKEYDPEVIYLDIQNAFKYSEVFSALRSDPELSGHGENSTLEQEINGIPLNYKSDYDHSRIAILIMQDKQAGDVNEKGEIVPQNSLRLSLRSADGTIWAELLANLFGGGGHGGAAGAAVNLPDVEIDTKLGVKINGEKTQDAQEILSALLENHQNPDNKPFDIQISKDDDGKTAAEIIEDVVIVMRKDEPKKSEIKKTANSTNGSAKVRP